MSIFPEKPTDLQHVLIDFFQNGYTSSLHANKASSSISGQRYVNILKNRGFIGEIVPCSLTTKPYNKYVIRQELLIDDIDFRKCIIKNKELRKKWGLE